MGNQMSVLQRAEDQEKDSETEAHQVASQRDRLRNGKPVMVSTHMVQLYEEVDLGISVQEDSAATSSPRTVESSAVPGANGENLGKEAKAPAAAAKARFFSTLSLPVPGRTADRAPASSGAAGPREALPTGAGNKGPSDSMALRPAAARGPGPHKAPGPAPAATGGRAPVLPESGGAAPSKPKEPGFLDKLFKLDKGQETAPAVSHQEAGSVVHEDQAQDTPGFPGQARDALAERDIVEVKVKGQEVTPVSCPLPRDPEELEIAKEEPQTRAVTEDNNSIMSFFKTLVSPNKAETKKDLEDPGAEKSPATSADLKSDKATFVPPETQGAAKNPTPTETAKEGAKQKGGPSSGALSKLFRKKSVKEDSVPTGAEENAACASPVEVRKSEEVDGALQTVDLSEEAEATPAAPEGKLKREERKPATNPVMAFLRQMSVKGDGGTTHSEEPNGKDSSSQMWDSSQKAALPAPEPTGAAGASPKGKEGAAKDKRAAETSKPRSSKQEAKEPAPAPIPAPCACACVQPAVAVAVAEANTLQSLQNGDRPQKRPEKRQQSFGGFFKGLGPKRMLDAQVQTDPVSIGPAGNSKCTGRCVCSEVKKKWPFPSIGLRS